MIWIKYLLCRHEWLTFDRNIYGDEIIAVNGRSWWRCVDCGKWIVGRYLHLQLLKKEVIAARTGKRKLKSLDEFLKELEDQNDHKHI